ncbi:MAG: LysM domain-containing protein [Pseudomonadota bacterium]
MLLSQMESPAQFFADSVGAGRYDYTVAPSDTLGSIAQNCLGNSLYFAGIAILNNIGDPSRLIAGRVLELPGVDCQASERDLIERSDPVDPESSVDAVQADPPQSVDQVTPTEATGPVALAPIDPRESSALPDDPVDLSTPPTADPIDALLETFTDHVTEGNLEPACAALDEILKIDRYNEDALLNKLSFCE